MIWYLIIIGNVFFVISVLILPFCLITRQHEDIQNVEFEQNILLKKEPVDSVSIKHNCGFDGKVEPIINKDLSKVYFCPKCNIKVLTRRTVAQQTKIIIDLKTLTGYSTEE